MGQELNWDAIGAIGELIGALTVVGTLIYFSIQIRSLSTDAYANSINQIQQGEKDLREKYIEHEEIIRKANEGESLSDGEAFILNEVFLSAWAFHHFASVRASIYGRDTIIPAQNFARMLRKYPGFVPIYESASFRNDMGIYPKEFLRATDEAVSEGGT